MTRVGYVVYLWAIVCFFVVLIGCNVQKEWTFHHENLGYDINAVATHIEYPDLERDTPHGLVHTPAPRTLEDEPPREFWNLSLDEVIRIALDHGEVIRDLGGRVLANPGGVPSVFDPAIRESDPRFGLEAALAAFDAQWATNIFWNKNDRAVNSPIAGGGAFEFVQDTANFQTQISKTAATGTQISIQNQTEYDSSNQPANRFVSAWNSQFELNVTQPLLRGAGTTYNRIAGPNAIPGLSTTTGVLLARINADVGLADFETGVRNFINDLEDAYWDLYFAYRDLDAKILARDSALDTWRMIHARSRPGLEARDREAQAREQYFAFQDLVQDTLSGAPVAVQSVGVYRGERRLRLLMGLPSNDGKLIRPTDEPIQAKIDFDWNDCLKEALARRIELRQQLWQIKRRELELIASRNFTLPQLDAVALYRWRGFGDDLTGQSAGRFSSAFQDLASGDHQEWQLGLQLNYTFGFRQAWAGVRNAELLLARERAVLKQQELEISHGLSEAIAEVHRAYAAVRVSFNRLGSAVQVRDSREALRNTENFDLNLLLQAQQRLSDAQTRYFQSLALHARAIKDVHLQKGSLLEYHSVHLSEGPWPTEAYADAAELRHRWRPTHLDYRFRYPPPFSHGPYAQHGLNSAHPARMEGERQPEEIPPGQPLEIEPEPPEPTRPEPPAPPGRIARPRTGKLR